MHETSDASFDCLCTEQYTDIIGTYSMNNHSENQ